MTIRSGFASLLCASLAIPASLYSQKPEDGTITYQENSYPLYPRTLKELPRVPSPLRLEGGMELIVAYTTDGQYAIIQVTVENGEPYVYAEYGKGKQLEIDAEDFPTLASRGLHSEEELDQTETITGKPVSEITEAGRPGGSSSEGFMSEEEDIISVLKGDNRLVSKMGLTHPEMARPLFHVWNAILRMAETYGDRGRPWDNLEYLLYDGRKVYLRVRSTKGRQESIFTDGIQGGFHIYIHRELDQKEKELLSRHYSHLDAQQVEEFINKLSHIHTGEMEPYYVMRYGFYEGHTDYRVDPIAIAFMFGLRDLEDIESAFSGRLDKALTEHH
ncbi:MAG: hypothetical protein WBD30_13050, partial [Bacteroidota bacterium]